MNRFLSVTFVGFLLISSSSAFAEQLHCEFSAPKSNLYQPTVIDVEYDPVYLTAMVADPQMKHLARQPMVAKSVDASRTRIVFSWQSPIFKYTEWFDPGKLEFRLTKRYSEDAAILTYNQIGIGVRAQADSGRFEGKCTVSR